jgi:Icc-related predicted phosphoesterase
VPPGDVLLHAGDLSAGGTIDALRKSINWLKELNFSHKIIMAGNHDLSLDIEWGQGGRMAQTWGYVPTAHVEEARRIVKEDGLTYLEHEYFTLHTGYRTWQLYGSPAAPVFHSEGAFQYESAAQAQEIYKRIPDDVDILLTHVPPLGILDTSRRGTAAGCEVLAETLPRLKSLRLHVFGHIHEAHGATTNAQIGDHTLSCVSVNAALQRAGQAVIVDLKN